MTMSIDQVIEQVRDMPHEDRVMLVKRSIDLVAEAPTPRKKRSLLDFQGVAAHLADGTDPQEHVRQLRAEWDDRDRRMTCSRIQQNFA